MGKLDGKVAVVTGGAGGIGQATAALFVKEGASVTLVDREEEALGEAAEAIGGDRVATVAADVSKEEDTARYVKETVDRFGGLDILFANAGTEGHVGPLVDVPLEAFDQVLAVNVRGPFLGIRMATPHLVERGGGSIIVTSSVAGLVGAAGLAPYCTSKHAVLGLVKTAAIELAPSGIRVNALNPGPIDNRMMESIEKQASPEHPEQVRQGYSGMVPMGRYGTNDEMARLALFLASDDSAYCTGNRFVADGGFTAQ
ncbi:MAG TPA: SDR family oxidoreductase [Sandaracinaceae bacterium LLY-WYZ-13_1]|nr:SDR family oxidoreductase [Sandaracinaceae bacterium LLY-WYZ-13_1]